MQVRVRCLKALALLFAAGLAACGRSEQASTLTGDGVVQPLADASVANACSRPAQPGCPCDETGAVLECGKVIERNGDYVTCSMGRVTCDGTQWGPCLGNRIVAQSVPGLTFAGGGRSLQSTTTTCANVCDPYPCTQLVNSPSDVDASGFLRSDTGGLSLAPGEGGTGGGTGPCKGLWCQVVTCDGGTPTSLSGVVYDPAGKNPLYNAYVYIPVDPTLALPAFTSGASCDTCAGTGTISAISLATTGPDGKFTLNSNVPAGSNIPLIIQMGKWRRKITLPAVTACKANVVAPANSRLPKNRFDGDGNFADIPKMAIATGSADPFECLLLKAGIDPAEIQLPGAGARIDFYRFNGVDRLPGGAPAGGTLTGTLATLNQYDAVLLPCEGSRNLAHNAQAANIVKYTDIGGRVFTTHFGYQWLATPTTNSGSAVNSTAFYGTANWDLDQSDYADPMTATIDQTFPKGIDFANWLINVGASTTLGKMTVNEPRHDADSAIKPPSQRWVYGSSSGTSVSTPDMLLSMTFNTPVAAAAASQCGRVVFSDFHVSADALVSTGACLADTDCGVTSTCTPGVVGACTNQTCGTASDCDISGSTCKGAVAGACEAATCSGSNPCNRGTCSGGLCYCTKDSHCGSNNCTNSNVCTASSCNSDADCGGSQSCNGGVLGVCQKACTKDSDCGTGGTMCSAGFCKGCYTSNDCPGSGTTCTGGKAAVCTAASNMFPLTCRNGDLSAQEKALEFMLFDLTACVAPDAYVPSAPAIVYNPVSFTQDYTGVCAHGQRPVWRELDWQATIPDTASIDFAARTADTTAALATAQSVTVAHDTTTTALPAYDVALLDTKTGGVFAAASPAVVSKSFLRLTITLNPISTQKASPTLLSWKVQYDCADAE